jgi:uncharacterized DUF497 family protein
MDDNDWHDNKLTLNLANHKVHFSLADRFDWETAMIRQDTRKDYGEDRFQAYGYIDGRVYCLVYTMRCERVRIISLRKANPREVKAYAEHN